MTKIRGKNVNKRGYTHLPRNELTDTVEPTHSTSSRPVQRRLFNDLVVEAQVRADLGETVAVVGRSVSIWTAIVLIPDIPTCNEFSLRVVIHVKADK